MWTFRRNDTLTALEIGTSKVVAIVAQLSPDEAINIVGLASKSRVLKEKSSMQKQLMKISVPPSIRPKTGDLEVHQLYLAVTGQHIRSHHFDLMQSWLSLHFSRRWEDIIALKTISLGPTDPMLHVIRQYFMVDENNIRHSPVGMRAPSCRWSCTPSRLRRNTYNQQ